MHIKYPWTNWIAKLLPILTLLTLLLTFVIFVLGILNASNANLPVQGEHGYLRGHSLQQRLELAFFWCVTPTVMLIATASENACLWTDRLQPRGAIVIASLALAIWLVQLCLWAPCLYPGSGVDGPSYCPAPLHDSDSRVAALGRVKTMYAACWIVMPLLFTYAACLVLGILTARRVKRDERAAPKPGSQYFRVRTISDPESTPLPSPPPPSATARTVGKRDMSERQRLSEAMAGFTLEAPDDEHALINSAPLPHSSDQITS